MKHPTKYTFDKLPVITQHIHSMRWYRSSKKKHGKKVYKCLPRWRITLDDKTAISILFPMATTKQQSIILFANKLFANERYAFGTQLMETK